MRHPIKYFSLLFNIVYLCQRKYLFDQTIQYSAVGLILGAGVIATSTTAASLMLILLPSRPDRTRNHRCCCAHCVQMATSMDLKVVTVVRQLHQHAYLLSEGHRSQLSRSLRYLLTSYKVIMSFHFVANIELFQGLKLVNFEVKINWPS